MQPQIAEKASWWRVLSAEEREQHRHLRSLRRNYYHTSNVRSRESVVGKAALWLLPWDRVHYPGTWRGVGQLVSRSPKTVWRWRQDISFAGTALLVALAEESESRCRLGMELAAALRK